MRAQKRRCECLAVPRAEWQSRRLLLPWGELYSRESILVTLHLLQGQRLHQMQCFLTPPSSAQAIVCVCVCAGAGGDSGILPTSWTARASHVGLITPCLKQGWKQMLLMNLGIPYSHNTPQNVVLD